MLTAVISLGANKTIESIGNSVDWLLKYVSLWAIQNKRAFI